MKRMAGAVSSAFLVELLGMENPHLPRPEHSVISSKNAASFLSGRFFQIDLFEPKTLLASEVPFLRAARNTGNRPPEPDGAPVQNAREPDAAAGEDATAPSSPAKDGNGSGESGDALPEPIPNAPVTSPGRNPARLSTGDKKVVLIYHSHPRESWVPELNAENVNGANDPHTNITLVGKRLAEKLEEAGVGAVHSATDYQTTVADYNWNFSYKYSLQTVREAMAVNRDIVYLFDIHRDAAGRDVTTAEIDGKSYARIFFIIGKKNEQWEKNEAFAKQLHDLLESKHPGLSRGIWDKGGGGHAEYNQSVSPNSVLIEIGGAYNTLEECYRTVDVLAETISELYWQAEKVNVTVAAR
jgi:stage II sporulation protein P